jgi:hypothetical protein
MPAKKRPKKTAKEEPAAEKTKAKAAYEEFRRRAEKSHARSPGADLRAGQPVGPPPHGMPQWGYPPPPPMHPWQGADPYRGAVPSPMGPGPRASLAESIGNLIRLGVDALNAGLSGGTRLMGGMSGYGAAPGPWGMNPWYDPWYGAPYGYPGYWYDCCSAFGAYPRCTPSVNNCY